MNPMLPKEERELNYFEREMEDNVNEKQEEEEQHVNSTPLIFTEISHNEYDHDDEKEIHNEENLNISLIGGTTKTTTTTTRSSKTISKQQQQQQEKKEGFCCFQ
ncbi:hypothetical protein ABK040_002700 [Willaertia magna]